MSVADLVKRGFEVVGDNDDATLLRRPINHGYDGPKSITFKTTVKRWRLGVCEGGPGGSPVIDSEELLPLAGRYVEVTVRIV